MFPIKDDNPALHPPILTVALIAINVLVFVWQIVGSPLDQQRKVFELAAVPYNVTHADDEIVMVFTPASDRRGADVAFHRVATDAIPSAENVFVQRVPAWVTLLTSMFMHGGFMHLLGNMVFLWVFGNNIEDACGRVRFLIFYLLAGLAASAAHVLSDPQSPIPTLGASGAVSGILGGYILLYPRARVLALLPLGFVLFTRYIPAVFFLGIWLLMQVFGVFTGGAQGVAWWAHLGGFAVGFALIKLFETREHRDRALPDPAHGPFDLQPQPRRGWR